MKPAPFFVCKNCLSFQLFVCLFDCLFLFTLHLALQLHCRVWRKKKHTKESERLCGGVDTNEDKYKDEKHCQYAVVAGCTGVTFRLFFTVCLSQSTTWTGRALAQVVWVAGVSTVGYDVKKHRSVSGSGKCQNISSRACYLPQL